MSTNRKKLLREVYGKHNGDHFLGRIAELLAEKVNDVKNIKSWEVAPDTVLAISGRRTS